MKTIKLICALSVLASTILLMNSMESGAQYSGKTIATGSGPRYYFNLFIASVTDKPEAKGFLATVEGTPYQHFPVDKTNIGGGETIDLSKVDKIEIFPAPREEAEAYIKEFYNTINIHLTNGEVIAAKRRADLFIVTESGRDIRLSSRNVNHMILLKTK